jgi:hypothetical protein
VLRYETPNFVIARLMLTVRWQREEGVGRRAVRKRRASDVDLLLAGRRRLHVSSFQEAPVLAQKAASRSCLRTCLRIFTDYHVRVLPIENRCVLLPGSAGASCVRAVRCILFRRDTPCRNRI